MSGATLQLQGVACKSDQSEQNEWFCISSAELLEEVARIGGSIAEEGGHLVFRAPKGAVPPALRAALRARKAELLEELRAECRKNGRIPISLTRPTPASTSTFLRSTRVREADSPVASLSACREGQTTALPSPVPTAALANWLRSQRLLPEPRPGSVRQRFLPPAVAPTYCLDLAECLDRIGAGTGSAEDAARIAAWLPTASIGARALHDADPSLAVPLLRELVRLERELRDAGVPVVFPPKRTEAERAATFNITETPAVVPAGE